MIGAETYCSILISERRVERRGIMEEMAASSRSRWSSRLIPAYSEYHAGSKRITEHSKRSRTYCGIPAFKAAEYAEA